MGRAGHAWEVGAAGGQWESTCDGPGLAAEGSLKWRGDIQAGRGGSRGQVQQEMKRFTKEVGRDYLLSGTGVGGM